MTAYVEIETEKAARSGDQFNFFPSLVRVGGVEPPSQPWEGYIMTVIRHPHGTLKPECIYVSGIQRGAT